MSERQIAKSSFILEVDFGPTYTARHLPFYSLFPRLFLPLYDPKLAEVLEGTEEGISVGEQWAAGSEKLTVPQRRP